MWREKREALQTYVQQKLQELSISRLNPIWTHCCRSTLQQDFHYQYRRIQVHQWSKNLRIYKDAVENLLQHHEQSVRVADCNTPTSNLRTPYSRRQPLDTRGTIPEAAAAAVREELQEASSCLTIALLKIRMIGIEWTSPPIPYRSVFTASSSWRLAAAWHRLSA